MTDTEVVHIIVSKDDAQRIEHAYELLAILNTLRGRLGVEAPGLTEDLDVLSRMTYQVRFPSTIRVKADEAGPVF